MLIFIFNSHSLGVLVRFLGCVEVRTESRNGKEHTLKNIMGFWRNTNTYIPSIDWPWSVFLEALSCLQGPNVPRLIIF